MNETKQTAVEWLLNEWPILNAELPSWLIEQAKEMEKDRLISAQMDMFHFLNNLKSEMMYLEKREEAEKFAEDYCNETYGGNK